ncbi:hypothetical protein F5Y18DRAFT_395039 [Xylariaceae sp. FL1019]|nr:hypothetical protein F5Y18DRAFT_395039 [Xylariaceae sp. FL1019]
MPPNPWEEHKAMIECLYLLENLKLEDVRSRMEEEHGFHKTKSQYEYQLKKWGIRKNRSREDWRYMTHRVRKRAGQGKMSNIMLCGMDLSSAKVRREMHRYTAIPTASEFGMRAPSPQSPGQDIIRVTTPDLPDCHGPWSQNLPWLQFTMLFNFELFQSPEMTKLLAIASTTVSPQARLANPLELCKEISTRLHLIPHNADRDGQLPYTSLWKGGAAAITTGLLKIILYHLANKDLYKADVFGLRGDEFDLRGHDRIDMFILQCLDWFTEYRAGWLTDFFLTRSPTTDATIEAVYACAIRQKRHALVRQLIQAGVDPNSRVAYYKGLFSKQKFERGKLRIRLTLLRDWRCRGLEVAIMESDVHLANILLQAGADFDAREPLVMNTTDTIAMYMEDEVSLEFIKSLISRGFDFGLVQALALAILYQRDHLASFLLETIRQNTDTEQHISSWFATSAIREEQYDDWPLPKIQPTLLHLAIISNNTVMTDILLDMTVSCVDMIDKQILKDTLVVASLAGDPRTVERLVGLDVNWDGDWTHGISPLLGTAWNTDFQVAEMIIRTGAYTDDDVDYYGLESERPLPIHVAAQAGNANLVQWLVHRGRALNVRLILRRDPLLRPGRPSWSWLVPPRTRASRIRASFAPIAHDPTPLQLALQSGDISTIEKLSHAELRGDELIYATRLGNEAIVSALLQRGASVLARDSEYSVLDAAVEAGNCDMISLYLLSGGVYSSWALLQAVKAAAVSEDISVVRLLTLHRPIKVIDRFESSALVIATWKAQMWLTTILLDPKFVPDSVPSLYQHIDNLDENDLDDPVSYNEGITPLSAAAAKGDRGLIQLLLQAGYTIQSRDLQWAIYWPDSETIKPVLSCLMSYFPLTKVDPQCMQHLLHLYIRIGDQQRIRDCIACLESLEFYIDTRTPLQQAAEEDNMPSIRLLIEKGANINAPAAWEWGATALQLAAINGNLHIARFLLAHGANINAPGARNSGRTALEGASEHGRLDMVQLLLDHGAQLEGELRIQYIRSVALANKEGHFALAKLLKGIGGWSDRDQEIYGRRNIHGDGYWVYTAETHDWHFRHRIHKRERVGTSDDSDWFTFASSSNDDETDSPYESEMDYILQAGKSREASDLRSDGHDVVSEENELTLPGGQSGDVEYLEEELGNGNELYTQQLDDEEQGIGFSLGRYLIESEKDNMEDCWASQL